MARRRQNAKARVVHSATERTRSRDIGSTEVYAARRHPIRNFPTFTVDLHALANWLKDAR